MSMFIMLLKKDKRGMHMVEKENILINNDELNGVFSNRLIKDTIQQLPKEQRQAYIAYLKNKYGEENLKNAKII